MTRFALSACFGIARSASLRGVGLALVSLLALATLACTPSGDPDEEARLKEGRRIFVEVAQPTCVTCHTLRHAEAAGRVGPNLDTLKPDSQRVASAVINGVGIMPSQAERLSLEQIGLVADYVSAVAGGAVVAE